MTLTDELLINADGGAAFRAAPLPVHGPLTLIEGGTR